MSIRDEYLPFGKPHFSEEEIAAVARVLRLGWVGMGQEVIAFEEELAQYLGAPYVVSVNSCTSALFLSLLMLGVGPGDEVICPSLTWCSTANAALFLGATPVFCDIDPNTLNVTPQTVSEVLTERSKAVVVVHFGGLAVDVTALRRVLPEPVAIVEDAAHALGARYPQGGRVGSSGNLVCFSFYANKNLSTGEGGAVALFDEGLAEEIRSLRQHGLKNDAWNRFSHPRSLPPGQLEQLGYKMNYTDLQACIGRVQLRRQEEFAARRLTVARIYCQAAEDLAIPCQTGCLAPGHARHLFTLRLPLERLGFSRDEALLRLRQANIGASVHYSPLHLMPLYCRRAVCRPLPATEDVCRRIITLPIGAAMSAEDAHYVVRHLKGLFADV